MKDARFSPDGKYFATIGDNMLKLWLSEQAVMSSSLTLLPSWTAWPIEALAGARIDGWGALAPQAVASTVRSLATLERPVESVATRRNT